MEIKDITSNELHLRVWKMAFITIVTVVVTIVAYNAFSLFRTDYREIQLRNMDMNDNVRLTAQARRDEAKALADKAMFEHMLHNNK